MCLRTWSERNGKRYFVAALKEDGAHRLANCFVSFFCLRHKTASAKAVRPPRSSVRPDRSYYHNILRFMNGLSNLDETYSEYSAAPTNDLIRFWESKVKGQGQSRPLRWRIHPRRRCLGVEVPSSFSLNFNAM